MPRKEVSSNNDIVYYIDEQKKVVVTKYYPNKFIFEQIMNVFSDIFDSVQVTEMFEKYFVGKKCFIGKSRCCPEDAFDLDLGKRLARNRAFSKYYFECIDIVENYIYYLESKLDVLSDLLATFESKIEKIEFNISELLEECN